MAPRFLRRDRAGCAHHGQVVEQAELLHLREQTHGVVAGDRGVEHLRLGCAQLPEILRVVFAVERREDFARAAGADLFRARLEGGHSRAAHFIIGPEVEYLCLGFFFRQPDGERRRLLARAGIHPEDIG